MANFDPDPASKKIYVQQSAEYYESAMTLSPVNSVIRAEAANLAEVEQQNCEAAHALYETAIERDPYYEQLYILYAASIANCTLRKSDGDVSGFEPVDELLALGVEQGSRVGVSYYQDAANILYQIGNQYQLGGEAKKARASAEDALVYVQKAENDQLQQAIQTFLDGLGE